MSTDISVQERQCPLCGEMVKSLPHHLRGGCPENVEGET
jgi:hypothetical protein